MAAELAGALAVGDDCPVCGSADHPRPAVAASGHPDAAAERRAQRLVDDAQALEHALDLRLNELTAAIETTALAAGEIDPQAGGRGRRRRGAGAGRGCGPGRASSAAGGAAPGGRAAGRGRRRRVLGPARALGRAVHCSRARARADRRPRGRRGGSPRRPPRALRGARAAREPSYARPARPGCRHRARSGAHRARRRHRGSGPGRRSRRASTAPTRPARRSWRPTTSPISSPPCATTMSRWRRPVRCWPTRQPPTLLATPPPDTLALEVAHHEAAGLLERARAAARCPGAVATACAA